MKITSSVIALGLLILCSLPVFGQQKREFTPDELERYEEKVRDITNFYFYLLNTVGSRQTSPYEKEIIVTESYKKYFVDDEVQIEDDLDERREVPTNKNVAAYLKDVDFFFKNVRFEHEIEEVTQHVNEKGVPFFKVSLTRRLNGVTVENDTLNNTLPRFIEINISEDDQDLRIASIYTTKLSEKEDLVNWWNELSFAWKGIFKDAIGTEDDSLNFDQVKQIIAIEEIDIQENLSVNTLEPLSKLTELEVINVSNTLVEDLSPLRNLTKIKSLNAANTKIDDLEALRYAFELNRLLMDNTLIDSIAVVANLKNLQLLSIQNTRVADFSPLEKSNLKELYATGTDVPTFAPLHRLPSLEILDLSFTPVDTLPDLSSLRNLKILNISNTNISNINSVSVLKELEEIRFDNTTVSSLQPLTELNDLKRIYCDYTRISRSQAAAFMARNPGTLVIFGSDRLLEWWKHLSNDWRNALLANRQIFNENSPSKEELASLTRLDSLNLSDNNLNDLEPLKMFHQLYILDISDNNISTLNVLRNFRRIHTLNISNNPIVDINILNELQELQELKMEGLKVNSLAPLYNHEKLSIVYADNTLIDDEVVKFFNEVNQEVLILYKTGSLKNWWETLDEEWKTIFAQNVGFKGNPDKVVLHKIVFLETIKLNNNAIHDLVPLEILLSPTEIRLQNLSVADLSPLKDHISLRRLIVSRMPVHNLEPLKHLAGLEHLQLSDTPLEDLEPVAWLKGIKVLILSSTQVKDLKYLVCLESLEHLNIANTRVRRLKHLYKLEQLDELICYNTRITAREVEKFKNERPECKVVYYR